MKTTTESAYAKINLTLDVVSKRSDGFHDIESVMHSLSLCDELIFTVCESDKTEISLEIKGNDSLPTDKNNLVCRAALLYLDKIGESARIGVTLIKKIPSAAGLAGGSSDAAATLRAMNRLYGERLSEDELLTLALAIGSDVPYCLVGTTALCEGRGEKMTRIDSSAKGIFVVAIGNDTVSTPRAYAELDRIYSDFKNSAPKGRIQTEKILTALSDGKISASDLYNIFEEAVIPVCPSVAKIKELMSALGALGTLMSGSGPSVFGMFETVETAEKTKEKLSELGYRAFVAKSL